MSRCTYVVPEKSLAIRSHRNHDPDPVCRRQARRHGLCLQHYRVLWRDHDRIVQRILDIPCRD